MSDHRIWYGREQAPPERVLLKAGPVEGVLENGDLRTICLGGATIARRIYVAVRDVNWATIPGEITDLDVRQDGDSFDITYRCSHRGGSIAFDWAARFVGATDGTIVGSMDGVALSTFTYGRIGFCVLHSPGSAAGATYRAAGPAGLMAGTLPVEVEPPRILDGAYQPLVPGYTVLEIMQLDGIDTRFEFEGDLFEMEDERSWTDASFKTYCTPYGAGIQSAVEGERFRQSVTVAAGERAGSAVGSSRRGDPGRAVAAGHPVRLTLGESGGPNLPRLGLGEAGDPVDLTQEQVGRLRALRLDHLRVELRLFEPAYPATLARARGDATALGCGLELIAFVSDDGERELAGLAARLRGVPVERVLVLHEPAAHLRATDARWVRLARRRLGDVIGGVLIGGGTDGNFAELVGTLAGCEAMDFVSYTANPQVHATDDTSIMENMEALGATVTGARSHAGGLPVVVSRLTLKPPFATYDVDSVQRLASGVPIGAADPRQATLFGAGWAIGSIKYLAEAGLASLTMCETAGAGGVMDRPSGTPGLAVHRAGPGGVFPMYHVLADLAEWHAAPLVECSSSQPRDAIGLALLSDRGLEILVANLRPENRQVLVGPLPKGRAEVRVLDAAAAMRACATPDQFRGAFSSADAAGGTASLSLGPYATATLRIASGSDKHRREPA